LVRSAGKPVLRARLAPDCADGAFRGARVVAFAGIGRPEKFFATMRDLGAELVGAHAFADHHPYTGSELEALARRAAGAGARLVTTRKDRARLPRDFAVEALDVRMRFEPADALKEILTAR
jgi:tetraacyldisaccharide 4'-kinase